ncbi:MAG: 3-isopropylmalate dehydratase small subunit [Rhodospirillaceae bacterium]|nr:3-isopropylmalate dehydratase small subunit [Rhodospirillaceae bacterium]
MEKFLSLTAVAVPLPMINVDTDIIIPARALKTTARDGLGTLAFHALRFDGEGNAREVCVFNQARYRGAGILIAGANFGCGSSREHAAWALRDMGVRCVIAPSFADIFASNCVKNGLLCVTLPQATVDALARLAAEGNTAGGLFTVDLERQCITTPDGGVVPFAVDAAKRGKLMAGLDDIGATLARAGEIEAFEQRRGRAEPWRASARLDVV